MSIIENENPKKPPVVVEKVPTILSAPPPPEVVEAIQAGIVQVVRRLEIFESDGETPWNPEEDNPEIRRMIEGNVTVDYNSAERRKIDLTLDNKSKIFRPDPYNGLWYDKIIRPYRGVRYRGGDISPRTLIVEANSWQGGWSLATVLAGLGFDKTDVNLDATQVHDAKDYSFVVALTGAGTTVAEWNLLKELYGQSRNIVTIGVTGGVGELPFVTTEAANTNWGIDPVPTDTPTAGAFTSEEVGGATTGVRLTGLGPGAVALAQWSGGGNPTHTTATLHYNGNGAKWLDIHLPNVNGTQARNLLRAALNFMRTAHGYRQWETPLGEFMIDSINTANFPHQFKITGRDYTKKLMLSKVERDISFAQGTRLRDLVEALAANAGIFKRKVGMGTEVLTSDMAFERGTPRWDIIKAACDAFNYEVYFDAFGYLVVRKFIDPTTGPISMTFQTGSEGNLVSWDKSLNDSLIYNFVTVHGDPADGEERLPYYGYAINNAADSPTRVSRLGSRVLLITTNWLNSDEECFALAEARLKITALEQYALNFSSIYYPWLEAGEIVDILDPDRLDTEPTRFLMDTLTFPLALGPMTATGKRITFVGSSGSPDEFPEEI